MLKGVRFLHGCGVLHRDINASNTLVTMVCHESTLLFLAFCYFYLHQLHWPLYIRSYNFRFRFRHDVQSSLLYVLRPNFYFLRTLFYYLLLSWLLLRISLNSEIKPASHFIVYYSIYLFLWRCNHHRLCFPKFANNLYICWIFKFFRFFVVWFRQACRFWCFSSFQTRRRASKYFRWESSLDGSRSSCMWKWQESKIWKSLRCMVS